MARFIQFAALLICVQQISVRCQTPEGGDRNEKSCHQQTQVSREFGKLESTLDTAMEILDMTKKRMQTLEEKCTKGLPDEGETDISQDDEIPENSKVLYRDCADASRKGVIYSGTYEIQLDFLKNPVSVQCDMNTAGGGWTVFQRRVFLTDRENFYRTWDEYKKGFGKLEEEFWLGNDIIFALSNQDNMTLRVDLEDYEGNARFAEYDYFRVRSETENYRLVLGNYSGDAGDAMRRANHMAFSTKDRDNDIFSDSCAQLFKGGWWYSNCHDANLNGLPHSGNHSSHADGINWKQFRGHRCSLAFTEMKLRPTNFTPTKRGSAEEPS